MPTSEPCWIISSHLCYYLKILMEIRYLRGLPIPLLHVRMRARVAWKPYVSLLPLPLAYDHTCVVIYGLWEPCLERNTSLTWNFSPDWRSWLWIWASNGRDTWRRDRDEQFPCKLLPRWRHDEAIHHGKYRLPIEDYSGLEDGLYFTPFPLLSLRVMFDPES